MVGFVPRRIIDLAGEYCSEACLDRACNILFKRKFSAKEAIAMKIAAQDFGNSGIVRNICDRCHAPIIPTTLLWRGQKGDYCSRECRREAEEKDDMTAQAAEAIDEFEEVLEPEVLEPEESSPIAAAPAKSKAKGKGKGKKTTVKAAPAANPAPTTKKTTKPAKATEVPKAAKAAKKSESGGTRTRYAEDNKIHFTGKEAPYGGKKLEIFNMMKEGMTVAKYKQKVIDADAKIGTISVNLTPADGLRSALRDGLIELSN